MSEQTITTDQVKSDFHIFQDFSDTHIQEAIDKAAKQVVSDQLSDRIEEATVDYARHVLFQDWEMSFGGVSAASTFSASQTMKDFGGYDRFIQDYNDLVYRYGVDSSMGEVWTE